jgi:hypothetical protein
MDDKPTDEVIAFRADAELRRRIDQMAAAEDPRGSRASWIRRTLAQVARMQKNERVSSP